MSHYSVIFAYQRACPNPNLCSTAKRKLGRGEEGSRLPLCWMMYRIDLVFAELGADINKKGSGQQVIETSETSDLPLPWDVRADAAYGCHLRCDSGIIITTVHHS